MGSVCPLPSNTGYDELEHIRKWATKNNLMLIPCEDKGNPLSCECTPRYLSLIIYAMLSDVNPHYLT